MSWSKMYAKLSGTQLFWARHRFRVKHAVFARDKGICAKCGCNTLAIRVLIDFTLKQCVNGQRVVALAEFSRKYGIPAEALERRKVLWDCDHIVPLVQCGSMFDLSNLQTLCIPCHAAKSRAEHPLRRADPNQLGLFMEGGTSEEPDQGRGDPAHHPEPGRR